MHIYLVDGNRGFVSETNILLSTCIQSIADYCFVLCRNNPIEKWESTFLQGKF